MTSALARFLELTEREKCEENLYAFLKAAWKYIDPAPFVGGWHLEAIAEHLQAVTDGKIKRLAINVPPRTSKAIDQDTPVFTTWGWKRHGDLAPGDFVFGPDGRPKRVLACTDSWVENAFSVVFDDRATIVAAGDHLWEVDRDYFSVRPSYSRGRKRELVRTADLRVTAPKQKKSEHRADCIRVCAPVELPPKRLIIDPYLFGAWLGDGSSSSGHLYAAEQDIDNFKVFGEIVHVDEPKEGVRTQAFYRIFVEGLQTKLRYLGVLGSKHIPEDYMEGSIEQRWELLRGLMDTDGTVDRNGVCSLSTKSLSMACDAQRLARSLGLKAGLRAHNAMLNGVNYGIHYIVAFVPPAETVIFRLARKQGRIFFNRNSRSRNRYVAAVKSVGPRTVKCIQVEGDIYLVGQAFVPTHNSSLISVAWPAWIWAQSRIGPLSGPQVQFLSASYAHTLSLRDSVKMRRLVSSPWYQKNWGSRFQMTGDVNTKGRFENTKGGYRLATSVDGTTTGEGGDIILADDGNSATEVESDLVRTSTNIWWDESMSTRLNDPKEGAFVEVQQRLHQEDLTGHIMSREPGDWVWLMLPMEYDQSRHCITYVNGEKFWEDPRTEEGELLCPNRFGKEQIDSLSKRLGPFASAGQLQQSPVPRGGGIIKEEWWGQWTDPTYPAFEYVLASLDTAYTEKEENDPSALILLGLYRDENQNPKIMVINGWQDRLTLPDLVERVAASCTVHRLPDSSKYKYKPRFRVDKLVIESKASGISVYQELTRVLGFSGHFGIELFNPTKLGDKQARVYSIQHLFSEGLISIPWPKEKDGENRGKPSPYPYKWAEEIIEQVTVFPRGSHDDYVDALSQGLRWLRDSGMILRTEEHAFDVEREMTYTSRSSSLYPV